MRQAAIGALFLGGLGLGWLAPLAAQAQTSPAARPLLDEAREAASAGRHVDALAALTGAIAAAPADAAAYIARARLFDELVHADLAAADYRVAVKLMPDDAGLQDSLCLDLALSNHDLDGALAACNAAVKLNPDSADALGVRGYLQLRRGAWDEAEKDYAAALSLVPADPNNTFGRGVALIHLGRAREGKDEISIATLAGATLPTEWQARGFGPLGEVLPGRPVTTGSQPVLAIKDKMLFLNKGEVYIKLASGCGMIAGAAPVDGGLSWSGECRFGLIHGAGKLTSKAGQDAPTRRFSYGRELTDQAGAAGERKLILAYQAAEKALAP
ncbi:MAG TPA: tetratricopeptide repeat protein [Hyphomonadaceae bacterium]|nr:tetratricopeptide repeat protein [Hyphomonadaceae bacterium]